MAQKQAALGRGLEALFGDEGVPGAEFASDAITAGRVFHVAVDTIDPNPYQPRLEFAEEALRTLANSIAEYGVIQPVTVRAANAGRLELVCGDRRVRAARIAGLERIPAYVVTADIEQRLAMALVENIQREDLNPIETALGYQRLMDECGLTHEEVAERVGKMRTTVTNTLRLLKLPPAIQVALRERKVTVGHARPLIALEREEAQLQVLREILSKSLSVRQVEERVRRMLAAPPVRKQEDTRNKLAQKEFENRLRKHFETRVSLQGDPGGKGRIVVHYYSPEDLDRVLALLLGPTD